MGLTSGNFPGFVRPLFIHGCNCGHRESACASDTVIVGSCAFRVWADDKDCLEEGGLMHSELGCMHI